MKINAFCSVSTSSSRLFGFALRFQERQRKGSKSKRNNNSQLHNRTKRRRCNNVYLREIKHGNQQESGKVNRVTKSDDSLWKRRRKQRTWKAQTVKPWKLKPNKAAMKTEKWNRITYTSYRARTAMVYWLLYQRCRKPSWRTQSALKRGGLKMPKLTLHILVRENE